MRIPVKWAYSSSLKSLVNYFLALQTDNRFEKMISSSANYISSIVTDGSYIGIVEFNWVGIMLKNLTLVTSDDDRQALLNALPPSAAGSTAIGDGLLKSIEVSMTFITVTS